MRRFRFAAHATVLATLFGIAGCTAIGAPSPPSRFYLLAPLEPVSSAASGLHLAVGPIRIAEYLDRPQIVTRPGAHALAFAEFDRWGEPLSESVSRVLAANLGALLETDRVQRHPWRDARGIDLRVELDVRRFDGPLAGPVEFEAHWRVRRERDTLERISRLSEPLQGSGYTALAAAMSRVLHTLSKEIATALAAAPEP